MTQILPITLTEPNLGKRHFHLNSLVNDAYQKKIHFDEIKDLPELSPVDRLFKIDLASKLRNLYYILQNLKDEDLLYVSRALKAKWLLGPEHEDIISPQWLEEQLFPAMITTAVSKMKNWLYLHLKDEVRCQKFYQYYKVKNNEYAIKFLGHCSKDFINSEVTEIAGKLSPKKFKILCEKSPKVAEIYFKNVDTNDDVKSKFLNDGQEYYNALKVVLKQDPNVFFSISEEIFNNKYSPAQTKYIMKHHKDKFDKKPELYTALLLHVETLAAFLTPDESKEVVLKLARAKYLTYWFSYKNVEPLIKRLKPEERSVFKQKVFVDKDIGAVVEEWPYKIPELPKYTDLNDDKHVFDDEIMVLIDDSFEGCFRSMPKRMYCAMKCGMECKPMKTFLDHLFDEYRFDGFNKTLTELRSRIPLESAYMNREYMMLVLVSKTGGRAEHVASLIELLAQHKNEPMNLKAAVVRSLVKRAAVWRLPQEIWNSLLEFARGLGLDGNKPEADCREGLHAVVIRQLLNGVVDESIRKAFLEDFSTFDKYSLNIEERKVVGKGLCDLLVTEVNSESDLNVCASRLRLLLDTLQTFKIPIETSPLIPAVIQLAKKDFECVKFLLKHLNSARIGRRALFREFFSITQTDASYLNALRHDITVLDVNKFVELIEKEKLHPEKFLRKMSIYFTENGGLADVYLNALRNHVSTNPEVKLSIARPLCILQGADLAYIRGLDVSQKPIARFAAAIRANMHAGRHKLGDIDDTTLPGIGAKAAANKLLVCPALQIEKNINLLVHWKNTVRIALLLAERNGKENEVFSTAAHVNKATILKPAIKYFKRKGSNMDIRIWNIVKPIIHDTDFSKHYRKHLGEFISNIKRIPDLIQADFFMTTFVSIKLYDKISAIKNMYSLLPKLDPNFVGHVFGVFTINFPKTSVKKDHEKMGVVKRYIRILVKFLLLCKSEEEQNKRFENLGIPFLECLETAAIEGNVDILDYIAEFFTKVMCEELFNTSYVSPLPILDKIVAYMNKSLPIEEYLKWHIIVRLNKCFYKALRDSLLENSSLFGDEKKRKTEGLDIVGRKMGHLIISDINQMKSEYFDSIAFLYQQVLIDYFFEQFPTSRSLNDFMVAVLKGILEEQTGAVIAMRFYTDIKRRHYMENDKNEELMKLFKAKNDVEMTFFMYGEYYSHAN